MLECNNSATASMPYSKAVQAFSSSLMPAWSTLILWVSYWGGEQNKPCVWLNAGCLLCVLAKTLLSYPLKLCIHCLHRLCTGLNMLEQVAQRGTITGVQFWDLQQYLGLNLGAGKKKKSLLICHLISHLELMQKHAGYVDKALRSIHGIVTDSFLCGYYAWVFCN